MARELRIEYAGAVYHVMARGNQGRAIFKDDKDRQIFLETLAEVCEKTGWLVHAWVLMNNHYHLLVETPEANLVVGMKWLQGTYTQRYNSRHKVYGHLFQGRYKAVILDGADPLYFQIASTYIHLNPARAGLVRIGQEPLKGYRWSSYRWYLKGARRESKWLCRQRVMGSLGLREGDAKGYQAYMEARVLEWGMKTGRKELEEQWKGLRRGWYLGGEKFLQRLQKRLDGAVKGRRRESLGGAARQAHDEAAAQLCLEAGLDRLGLSWGELRQMPKGAPEKLALAWWMRERTVVSLRWVSERLEMGHYTRVTQAVSRLKRRAGRKMEKLKRRLMALADESQRKEL
jgi:putative transposase